MRFLSVLTLVLLLPFTGVRMVCLDADHDGPGGGPQVAATPAEGASCAHQCPVHAKPAAPRTTKCVFVTDHQCTYALDGVTAVLQRGLDLTIALASTPMNVPPAAVAHPAPALPPPGPPPKA
jgi:hypothetical protein